MEENPIGILFHGPRHHEIRLEDVSRNINASLVGNSSCISRYDGWLDDHGASAIERRAIEVPVHVPL